jgi:hypothetical protein
MHFRTYLSIQLHFARSMARRPNSEQKKSNGLLTARN